MPRYKKRSFLKSKTSEQHSHTAIDLIGPATTPVTRITIRDTQVGARDPAGSNDTIQLGRSFAEECNLGDVCKYLNVFIAVAPRIATTQGIGWLEYAVVTKRMNDTDITNANLGTNTLGDVCTKYFRNECFWTGFIPVGIDNPSGVNLHLKVPPKKQKLLSGEEIVLYLHFRTQHGTETGTANVRVVSSFIYRNYH